MTGARLRRPVQAVTFDLDFTLWDLTGVLHHAEAASQRLLEQRYPEVGERYDAEGLRQLRDAIAERRADLRHDVTALRREALRVAGAEAGYAGAALSCLVDEAFETFLEARHEVAFYDDAMPVLEALHGRVRLGAVSNGNADVRRLGLERYFDFAISAVEIGAAKPARLVFEAAAHRAGAAPGHIVHVGDDVHSDVTGAAAYGMQAVWLNRAEAPWPKAVPAVPHVQVPDLWRLLARVEECFE